MTSRGRRKMATGSVRGEKAAEESEKSPDNMWSSLTEIYRKNGFSTGCSEKSFNSIDSKLTKYNCIVKITKQSTTDSLSGSIHLRPLPEKTRPKNLTKRPCTLRDNHTRSGSINNNNDEVTSTLVSEDMGDTKLSSSANDQCVQLTKSSVHRLHSGSELDATCLVNEIGCTDVRSTATNGHKRRNGQIHNGHISKLCMSPPVNNCRIKLVRPPQPPSQTKAVSQNKEVSQNKAVAQTKVFSPPTPSCPQLNKAAKISPSSPEGRLTTLHRTNGVTSCGQSTPPSVLSGFNSSGDSTKWRKSESGSRCSSVSSASSQSCADDQRRNNSWPSLALNNRERSSSSTSSLVSLSSRDGGSAPGATKASTLTTCKWSNCVKDLEASELNDHLHNVHVRSQEGESFVCLWANCKVYDKSSSSRKWLERHVLFHSGDKPFKCIVDKCGQQFPSQYGLERHVNGHFRHGPKPGRHKEDTPSKNKKKKAKRKRPLPVKTDDFFDQRIMAGVQHRLLELSESTAMDVTGSGNQITFHSAVIARRRDTSGLVQVLLRWTPEHILSDSWVPESQVDKLSTQVHQVADLPRDDVANIHHSLFVPHRNRKHRRK